MIFIKNEMNDSHGDLEGYCCGKWMLTGSRNMIIISCLLFSDCNMIIWNMIIRCIMQVESTKRKDTK